MSLPTSDVPWSAGTWSAPPQALDDRGSDLLVTAREGSDAWVRTAYGFTHDDAHGLLAPFPAEGAVEVDLTVDFDAQFDQAGVLLRADAETWVKAGIEVADGVPQLGAVVTRGASDWSVGPVPDWAGQRVTIRLSRAGDAVTVRARAGTGPFRLVRVAPFPAGVAAAAGPYCCAPTRAGLVVTFHAWRTGPADAALH